MGGHVGPQTRCPVSACSESQARGHGQGRPGSRTPLGLGLASRSHCRSELLLLDPLGGGAPSHSWPGSQTISCPSPAGTPRCPHLRDPWLAFLDSPHRVRRQQPATPLNHVGVPSSVTHPSTPVSILQAANPRMGSYGITLWTLLRRQRCINGIGGPVNTSGAQNSTPPRFLLQLDVRTRVHGQGGVSG